MRPTRFNFSGLFPRGSTTHPCVPQVVSLFNAFRLFSMEWVLRQRPHYFWEDLGGGKNSSTGHRKRLENARKWPVSLTVREVASIFVHFFFRKETRKSQKPNHKLIQYDMRHIFVSWCIFFIISPSCFSCFPTKTYSYLCT